MLTDLRARPHINGNTPDHFRETATRVRTAAAAMREAVRGLSSSVTHGRNYQHMPDGEAYQARSLDLARYEDLGRLPDQLDRIADELMIAASE